MKEVDTSMFETYYVHKGEKYVDMAEIERVAELIKRHKEEHYAKEGAKTFVWRTLKKHNVTSIKYKNTIIYKIEEVLGIPELTNFKK